MHPSLAPFHEQAEAVGAFLRRDRREDRPRTAADRIEWPSENAD